jgi:hypothetical protein
MATDRRRFRRRASLWIAAEFRARSRRDGKSTAGIDTAVPSQRDGRSRDQFDRPTRGRILALEGSARRHYSVIIAGLTKGATGSRFDTMPSRPCGRACWKISAHRHRCGQSCFSRPQRHPCGRLYRCGRPFPPRPVSRTITQKGFQSRLRSCSHRDCNFRHPQLGGTNEQIQNLDGANRGRGGSSHLSRNARFGRGQTARSVARGRHRGWRRSRFGGGCGSIHVLLGVRLRQIRILWLRAFWSMWRRSLLLIAAKSCEIHKDAI